MAKNENMIITLLLKGKDLLSEDAGKAAKSIDDLNKKLKDLEEQQKKNDKRNEEYQKTLAELAKQEKEYKKIIEALRKEKDESSKENVKNFEKEVEAIEKERDALEKALIGLEALNSSNKKSLDFYKKQSALLNEELKDAAKNSEDLKKNSDDLSKSEEKLGGETKKTTDSIKEQTKATKAKIRATKKLKEETDDLAKSQSDAAEKNREKEIEQLKEKIKLQKESNKTETDPEKIKQKANETESLVKQLKNLEKAELGVSKASKTSTDSLDKQTKSVVEKNKQINILKNSLANLFNFEKKSAAPDNSKELSDIREKIALKKEEIKKEKEALKAKEEPGIGKPLSFLNKENNPILKKAQTSDDLSALFSDDLSAIADAFDLDTVTESMVDEARKIVYEHTQKSLEKRGLGETIEAFRSGDLYEGPTNFSLAEIRRYAREGRPQERYKVNRKDVLIDSNAFFPNNYVGENEIVLKSGKLSEKISNSIKNIKIDELISKLEQRLEKVKKIANDINGISFEKNKNTYNIKGFDKEDLSAKKTQIIKEDSLFYVGESDNPRGFDKLADAKRQSEINLIKEQRRLEESLAKARAKFPENRKNQNLDSEKEKLNKLTKELDSLQKAEKDLSKESKGSKNALEEQSAAIDEKIGKLGTLADELEKTSKLEKEAIDPKIQKKALDNDKKRLELIKKINKEKEKSLENAKEELKLTNYIANNYFDIKNSSSKIKIESEKQADLDKDKNENIDEEEKKIEKIAKLRSKLNDLLEKETNMEVLAGGGDFGGQLKLDEYREEIENVKIQIEKLDGSYDDILESSRRVTMQSQSYGKLQAGALELDEKREIELKKLIVEYGKLYSARKKLSEEEDSSSQAMRDATLDLQEAKLQSLRRQIVALGGSYKELEKDIEDSRKPLERSSNLYSRFVQEGTRADKVIRALKDGWQDSTRAAGNLSRRLGRLGLAVRGLLIAGALAFARAVIAAFGALAGQAVALAGSLIYAASALGGVFVAAAAQAIPVIGLLAATFQRLSLIQEAVNQNQLAQKQSFGDTGAEEAATAANERIADAQRRLKEAQQELNEARKDARKELEDLIIKEKEAELAFKGATLSQLEARRELAAAISGGDVEGIARAQLGAEESNLGVITSRRELREARRAAREGERSGIRGTDTYKNAAKALADAQRDLASAQRDTASAADTQSAAQRNLAFALSQLSSAEKKLYKQFITLKERFEKVFRPITDIIIGSFSKALSRVEKLIFNTRIVEGFRNLSTVIADQIGRISKVLTGKEFTGFFERTLERASDNLPIVTDGFIALARIFKNLAEGAAPALNRFLEYIVGGLERFNKKLEDTSALDNFFQTGLDHFEAWMGLIGALIGLIGELMGASSDSALGTLESLTETINNAKEALASDDSGARNFFEDSAKGLKEIGRIIVSVGAAIVSLSSSKQVKALADVFTEVLVPGLEMGIKIVGFFVLALDQLLVIPIVAELLQLGAAFAFVAAAISSIAAIFLPLVIMIASLGRVAKVAGADLGSMGSKFAGITGKIKGFEKILSPLLKFLPKALTKVFGFLGPVGLIIAGVIELIIGVVTALKENFGGITDYLKEEFSGLGDAFANLGSAIGDIFSELFGGSGGIKGFKEFLSILWDIVGAIFNVIGFIGKLAGALAIFAFIRVFISPLKLIINILAEMIKYVAKVIGAFKRLFSGEISFGDFINEISSAVWGLLKGILRNIGEFIGSAFKGLANIVFAALEEAMNAIFGEKFANSIINTVIDIINWVIRKINDVTPDIIGDLDEIDDYEGGTKSKNPAENAPAGPIGPTGPSKPSKEKTKKENKDAAKATLENFAALNLTGGASKKNAKLNDRLAESLGRSSRAHRRATNLQESLNKAAERGRRHQARYAESVRKTAKAEERMANAIARARRIRADVNDRDRASSKIRRGLADSTRAASRVQDRFIDSIKSGSNVQAKYNNAIRVGSRTKARYEDATRSATRAQNLQNRRVKTGTNYQEDYGKYTKTSTKRMEDQTTATRKLSRRFGSLNRVLKVTGENSRALGMVFKTVTNKILSEFNVKTLKVELPKVGGMFKDTMGDTQGFQRGGYFGNKGARGADDRTIMVAGGEAILTGNHQAAVDTAFSIANQTAGFPYQNLDHMFSRDKRPHATAKRYNRGGRVGGRGNSIVIPRSVPDADGALPGLDLMAYLLNKYFGLSLGDGLRNSNYGSDHEWGGAIDVSNGITTPQMDAAWFWLTRVLGGAKAGSFVENYSGGAIKQMLYRTMIGGDHFDHIHLALTETYARNVEALTKILTGQAIPVGTGGSMFMEAPKLKKPKIKSNNQGAIQKMLQGQSDMLTKASNRYMSKKIVPMTGPMTGYQPTTAAIVPGSIIKTGYTVYDDPPPGSFGPLDQGYAELGTATASGLTGGGYLAQAFGLAGELPENFPLDVTINGKTKRLYKRDRGWGQGSNTHGIDIWQDSWGFFNLNANSSGQAVVKAANKSKKRGEPGPQYQIGGKIPEFDDGGIVPGPIGAPRLVKAHGGETILPTHKYNNGGMVPRYQTGGRTDGIVSVTSYADIKNTSSRTINNQIKKIVEKLKDAENKNQKSFFSEKLKELKDRLLLSQDIKELNKEIKDINKEIKDVNKKIKEAEGDQRKELKKKLKGLEEDLKQAKADRKATVAFEGQVYNTSKINEFILLLSDRINSFINKIDEEVTRMSTATAMWTYKIMKVDGKKIVSRVNSAVSEAQRGLSDLVKETGLIASAIKETRRAEKKARQKIRKTRIKFRKDENKLLDELDKAESKEAKKRIREELADLRKSRKEDNEKLKTSIKNSQNKRKELLERQAENLANRYEAQNAVFEERMAVVDSNLSMMDTRIEIATLQNQDAQGELTEAGKAAVRAIYNERATELNRARGIIESQLAEATRTKNIKLQRELNQQLLDNQLALLQNTQSIKELDDNISDVFDFKSTNWQTFRKAIFTGNGPQVLPQFQSAIPQLATGGYIQRSGLAYLHAAEVVVPASQAGTRNSGPLVDTINFTQPMEVADPVAISNTIGFKLSTLKSL